MPTMPNTVQMSIKMDSELRDHFMVVAAMRHRPAAQIVRDLMRLYITEHEEPNELTAETIRKARKGKDVFDVKNAAALFKALDI